MVRGEPIPMFGDGTTERDYTYIDDIIEGVMSSLSLLRGSRAPVFELINLGESRTVQLREMIDTLASQLGITPRIDRQPPQPGDVDRTFADVDKARAMLGYDPSTEFAEGIRRFLEWFPRDGAPPRTSR